MGVRKHRRATNHSKARGRSAKSRRASHQKRLVGRQTQIESPSPATREPPANLDSVVADLESAETLSDQGFDAGLIQSGEGSLSADEAQFMKRVGAGQDDDS
jgi:hypothetical protein